MVTQRWLIREKGVYKIEVHVAGFCLSESSDGTLNLLIGKRTPVRRIFPNKWECGGGQVHTGESLREAIWSHMKEEFDIEVNVIRPVLTYEIHTPDGLIPGVRFLCTPRDMTQEAVANPDEFTECRWIGEREIDEYDFIPGLAEQAKEAIAVYRKLMASAV